MTNDLYLGRNSTGVGRYNLSSTGSLSAKNEYIGYDGTGIFTQNGGTNTITNNLIIANSVGRLGIYTISGGTLTAGTIFNNDEFEMSGGTVNSSINNSGTFSYTAGNLNGQLINDGTVYLNGDFTASNGMINNTSVAINTGRIVTLNGSGLENNGSMYLDGTLQGNGPQVNNGQMYVKGTIGGSGGLTNKGTMTLTGGTTTVNADVTNQDTGKIEVAYNPAIFTGNVINNGTFKTTDTNVAFAGNFTNNGAYISDPSTNYFNELTIGAEGYLLGGLGDNFFTETNLINNSTQDTLWNTDDALLGFSGTGSHEYYLAGEDLGADISGYTDNFAWGTLNVEGNLNLFDGNATEGGAQYLSVLDGAVLLGDIVSNISGQDGLNIYYLASASGNEYLNGLKYNLTSGGFLIPVENAPVPIPPAILLFGTGLLGLIAIRRRVCS
ncbi:MAG: hypothetical protein KKC46_12445 [Proteobacteria bacterium]|nr:hypothetical protein [Pseudomonadota bacterium]